VQDKGGNQELCHDLRAQTQAPGWPQLPADPVDHHGGAACFQALARVALALDEQAMPQRRQPQDTVARAHPLTQQRRRYEAARARRRDERVGPEHRLVADELERRWEAALQALHEAEAHYPRLQQAHPVVPLSIPRRLRPAFIARGTSLPTVGPQDTLSRAQRKAPWRCLLDQVVRQRVPRETIRTRLVWRGGAGRELEGPSPMGRRPDMRGFAEMAAPILALEPQGTSDEAMAQRLTTPGFRSPQRPRVLPSTGHTMRLQHGRLHRYRGPRPRHVPGGVPVSQRATARGVKAHWVDHLSRRGRIRVTRDPATRRYLFPARPATLKDFRRLPQGHISHVQS
jgi:hypothetical protein